MISPDGFDNFMVDELKKSTPKFLLSDFTNKKEKVIDSQTDIIRYYCSTNFIDEKIIFQEIFNKLDKRISFCTEHLYDPEPAGLLKNIAVISGTALGAILGIQFIVFAKSRITYPSIPRCKLDTIAECAAAGLTLAAGYKIYKAIYPTDNADAKQKIHTKQKSNLDKLIFIKSRINQILAQPYIDTSLKITRMQ